MGVFILECLGQHHSAERVANPPNQNHVDAEDYVTIRATQHLE